MSHKRINKSNINQKYELCIYLENNQECKSVVPSRWVNVEKNILWWPRGMSITNKKFCDADDSWRQYKLLEVMVTGKTFFIEIRYLPSKQ